MEDEYSREDTQTFLDEQRHEEKPKKEFAGQNRMMVEEPILQENSQEEPMGVNPPIGSDSGQGDL